MSDPVNSSDVAKIMTMWDRRVALAEELAEELMDCFRCPGPVSVPKESSE